MEAFVEQYGYLAVGALIFLESVFPPIPSEAVLPFAGFCTSASGLSLPFVILSATVGSLAGAYLLYAVGRALSAERLMSLVETRPLRLLGFRRADIERVVGWFERHGQMAVLLCRCVPGLRSLISIPAGTARMGLGLFTTFTALGSLVWNTLLCSLGAAAGSAWHEVSQRVSWVSDAMVYTVVIALFVGAAWWVSRRILPAWREGKDRHSAR